MRDGNETKNISTLSVTKEGISSKSNFTDSFNHKEALEAIADFMENNGVHSFSDSRDLLFTFGVMISKSKLEKSYREELSYKLETLHDFLKTLEKTIR